MQIIKVADDGTITINLSPTEIREIVADLDAADWNSLSPSARALYHYLDMVRPPAATSRAAIFPGGGF
ncbi:hypothetical protein AQI95_24700 [Streptomyces yokosukanensis]|uniref:Uncharacterized protein n=1 Tax=Streptomyces yokosukanensis TaxID=67386 RepID=A0A101P1E9_9ACTN|nr:hypothetical protein [Streptomyces yokosukanensis]KUN03160.1 hypothetical protein AQI95_24700 [Streptomyces yokosukanensis]